MPVLQLNGKREPALVYQHASLSLGALINNFSIKSHAAASAQRLKNALPAPKTGTTNYANAYRNKSV
jgi:hypothetical protein